MSKNLIYCCGMYRSGTTLIYNILKQAQKEKMIKKVHQDWLDHKHFEDTSVYSYRDVRDVIASFCYRDKMNFNSFNIHRRNAINFCRWMIEYDYKFKEFSNKNPARTLIFRYESDIVNDNIILYEKITNFFGISTFPENLKEKFKFEKIKKHTDSIKKHEPETEFWPNHLNDGSTEKFKKIFSHDEINLFYDDPIIHQWLKENNYV